MPSFLTTADRAIRPVLEPGTAITDDQAEQLMAAESCPDIGADTRPAALSMYRHKRIAGRVVLALLAIPALAALVAVGGFIARHWPLG